VPGCADDGRDGRPRGPSVLTIAQRVQAVIERVHRAADAARRDPDEITILAASKRQSTDAITAAAEAGIRVFGENYVPELLEKAGALPDITFHFIGHLQRNKAKRLVPHIAMLHTVDTPRLATALHKLNAGLEVLLQVNIGGEETKSGVLPADLATLAGHLINSCPGVRLTGLMTIPPPGDPQRWLPAMRRLRDETEQSLGIALPHLSMGMSGDLEQAIANSATIVRVGTAVFGPRT